jgi:hypothetical protein
MKVYLKTTITLLCLSQAWTSNVICPGHYINIFFKLSLEYIFLKIVRKCMNKKNPEQITSGRFNYLLNLGRVTKQCFD